MKQRVLRKLKSIAILMAVGFIYTIIYNLLGLGIPCPIHSVFHIYCGGCGVTRMFINLSQLRFYDAFSSNCVLFCMLPFALVFYIRHCYVYIRFGTVRLNRLEHILIWIAVIILLIFTVVRNLYPIDIFIP